jgi:RNA polymerase sigma-70 factor (ECF subfamily)
MLEEAELVRGLQDGAAHAMRDFVDRTHHPLWWMAGRLTFDPDLRQDWCHDVLLGILDDVRRGGFTYRGPGSFWGWFRKRAYYRLLDLERRRRLLARRERQGDDSGHDPLETFCVEQDPGDELDRTAFLAALEGCLERLDHPMHRRALALRLFEERSYEDIATDLASPLNTVRAWIRRARLSVRECVARALGWLPGERAE